MLFGEIFLHTLDDQHFPAVVFVIVFGNLDVSPVGPVLCIG